MYGRSPTGVTVNRESRGNAVRPFAHPADAKARGFAGHKEAASVVLNHQLNRIRFIDQRKGKTGWVRMLDRIGDRFMSDSEQSVGDSQGESAFASV